MTSSICNSIPEGVEGQLKDTRDQQLYYVGKMKDGKCWMLQNLALGSTSGATVLKRTDSNIVAASWTLPESYASAGGGSNSTTNTDSWNFGKWVLATPLLTTSCEESGSSSVANCTRYGFVDVRDTTKFQPTYTATTGDWNGANATSSTLVAVNCTEWEGSGTSKVCTAGTYDPHYLVGNLYSWGSATAGTGGTITSGEAVGSICPEGWKLPTSNTTVTGSFAGLLSKYGVDSSLSGAVNGTTYNIAGAPLRFVRGGYVSPGGSLGNAGGAGYYWSSTPDSSSYNAYSLYFYDSRVVPSYTNRRFYGQSVRCISE